MYISLEAAKCEEYPTPTSSESYSLNVDSGGAYLTSSSVWGLLHGLETFYQLVYGDDNNSLFVKETDIIDFPRFKHRGVLVDTARHFLRTDTLYEILDGMAMNKFNVLHWHIVDDQSFPYGSEVLPDLPNKGSYFPKAATHIYSIEEIKSIIEYARVRGIRVIPEFDTPGHTQAWGKGQPGLLTQCCGPDGKFNGNYGPADVTNQENYAFIDKLWGELRTVFKDQYIHLGGDEVSFQCWQSNPNITAWMKEHNIKDYAKLEEIWIQNVINITENHNFDYVVWEEVFNNGININPQTVVEVWLPYNPKSETYNVTKAGYRALISAPWYLDYISYGADWKDYYKYEPLDFNGTAAQEALVMGGETCLWAEFVDASNFVSRLFPRASAVAERLWSARDVTDTTLAAPRILDLRCKMIMRGVHAEPANGPSACPVEFDAKYTKPKE